MSGPGEPTDADAAHDRATSDVVSSVQIPSPDEVRAEDAGAAAGRKLQALLELLGDLGRSIETEDTLDHLLDGLFRIFPQAERGFVGVRDPSSGEVTVRASKRRTEKVPEGQLTSRTIVDRVLERKEAVLSLDASQDPRFLMAKSVSVLQLRSVMCAPLLDASGEALGVLQLDAFNAMKAFNAEDLAVLANLAPQAAMALKYAQLHEEALRRKTLDRDLELARRVQRALLPTGVPDLEGYAFQTRYETAYQVGGDFFDYVPLPDGRWAVVIADAVGKGVSAALLIAKLSGELRTYLSTSENGAEALRRMGESFDAMSDELHSRFVTLALLVLDPESHRVEVVNAGHPTPLLRTTDGRVTPIGGAEHGPALGMFPDRRYESVEITLAPGDRIALYTDGFTEAMSPTGALYGLDRLKARLALPAETLEDQGRHILDDVEAFVAGESQSDDMCLICVGRRGPD